MDDIFRSRIELLIIMAKDFLNGKPLGAYQLRAMEKNAIHIEIECYSFFADFDWIQVNNPHGFNKHAWHQLKLMALMMKAVAKGSPAEQCQKMEMQEMLKAVTNLLEDVGNGNDTILNVA
ncbi:MAG: hypothetical protein PVH87_07830 [Desulfobacteraceae bacterium]